MKQEDKDLLLKDLCSRLPYGVKIDNMGKPSILTSINNKYHIIVETDKVEKNPSFNLIGLDVLKIEDAKPYLIPLSKMTEERRKEYESLCIKETSECTDLYGIIFTKDYYYDTIESIDYLYKNHIDNRGLIPKGLALDATGKNIY